MHTPVLLNEVLHYLSPQRGEKYIDATFGAGGYSRAILQAADCHLLSLDRDQEAKFTADKFKQEFKERFTFAHGEFCDIDILASQNGFGGPDGIVFDIGVSSMQLDQAERGFSFQHDGPLDMRMDRTSTLSAEHVVNSYSEKQLADIIFNYGDERKSFAIAKAIVAERAKNRITTTGKLAQLIRSVVGRYKDTIDPATRTFQALRMEVNDELRQLEQGLIKATELLKIGGKLVVVTFHSGEDRIVKAFFNKLCGKLPHINRHMPFIDTNSPVISFESLHKGAILATDEEVERNPRSRSAKLRAITRIK